jgi:hypothetical protein
MVSGFNSQRLHHESGVGLLYVEMRENISACFVSAMARWLLPQTKGFACEFLFSLTAVIFDIQ